MRISLVITGINHENTIMEATESVLSQTRLPDEFGMVIGPSIDRTREFVDFYRDELDFAYFPDEIDAARYGHGKLRLEVMRRLNQDYVLFLPAHSVLYPGALEQLEKSVEQAQQPPDLIFSPFRVFPNRGEPWDWSLDTLGYRSILSLGPVHPAMVCYRQAKLTAVQNQLKRTSCGPFTTLGWVLHLLKHPDARAESISECVGEVWSFVEGAHCWTRSVEQGISRISELVQEIVPEGTEVIEEWEQGTEYVQTQDSFRDTSPGNADHPWYMSPGPFSE